MSRLIKTLFRKARWPLWVLYWRFWRILGAVGLDQATLLSIAIYILKYRKFKAKSAIKKGFEDHRASVATDDIRYISIFKRLVDSYNKAKEEQVNVAQPYQVGRMWQGYLDENCRDLIAALRDRNTVKLQALLENFDREWFTYGLGGATNYFKMKWNPLHRYEFVNTWYKYLNIYKELAGEHAQLTYPLVGNPAGMYCDGQVIPVEAIRFHYHATEILSLLRDVNNAVICEIGGGLGGQAYKVLSNSERPITYILLDIPEMLAVSSYFLMAALPEKRFLLYGEGSLDSGKLVQYDVILMPNFMLPQLSYETVDLFFNSCSFSEMDRVTVEEYIRQIQRTCRRYFMHINHNAKFVWHDQKKEIVNMPSTEIILDPGRFKKLYQHPGLFARLDDIMGLYWYYKAKYIAFLYERIRPAISEQFGVSTERTCDEPPVKK
jgi:hypothetical protein